MTTIGSLDDDRLSALVDTLLPGTHGFPPASATHVPARLMTSQACAEFLRPALAGLDAGFCDLSFTDRVVEVSALEQRLGPQFQTLVAAAYSAYYTDRTVLDIISRTTGYRHPPQPSGYAMPVFNEAILDTVRQAAPSWRDARLVNLEGKTP